jgi:CO/xanthine dehydrogenase Mo-binding subunit
MFRGHARQSAYLAAIANAIFHATGKRLRELPICIEQLL